MAPGLNPRTDCILSNTLYVLSSVASLSVLGGVSDRGKRIEHPRLRSCHGTDFRFPPPTSRFEFRQART